MAVRIKFWGVRGSIATPSPRHIAYGGNTSCIEVRLGDKLVILDAGTGIRNLGNQLVTEAEFPAKTGWGHSTWNEGVRLCREANVESLAIFHHDPDHEDDVMDAIEAEARAEWENVFIARENMEVVLE